MQHLQYTTHDKAPQAPPPLAAARARKARPGRRIPEPPLDRGGEGGPEGGRAASQGPEGAPVLDAHDHARFREARTFTGMPAPSLPAPQRRTPEQHTLQASQGAPGRGEWRQGAP